MKILLIAVCASLWGCFATMGLPDHATDKERAKAKAADCVAAQELIKQADLELIRLSRAQILDAEAVRYWRLSRLGAQAWVTASCAGVKK